MVSLGKSVGMFDRHKASRRTLHLPWDRLRSACPVSRPASFSLFRPLRRNLPVRFPRPVRISCAAQRPPPTGTAPRRRTTVDEHLDETTTSFDNWFEEFQQVTQQNPVPPHTAPPPVPPATRTDGATTLDDWHLECSEEPVRPPSDLIQDHLPPAVLPPEPARRGRGVALLLAGTVAALGLAGAAWVFLSPVEPEGRTSSSYQVGK